MEANKAERERRARIPGEMIQESQELGFCID